MKDDITNEEDEKDLPLSDISPILKKLKGELCAFPLSRLIGQQLSPSKTQLSSSPTSQPNAKHTGLYWRSGKHPLKQHLQEYPDSLKLGQGGHAHIGNFCHPFQALGDKCTQKLPPDRTTSPGNGLLYEALLSFQREICAHIVSKTKNTTCIKVNFFHDYPAIMVYINPEHTPSLGPLKKKQATYKAWVEYLISFFIGLLNSITLKKRIPIELQRRSGFGFTLPSIALTGLSMRISVGLIPHAYADLIIEALNTLDKTLEQLKASTTPFPKESFYGSMQHRTYLGNKYPPTQTKRLIDILPKPIEKAGKSFLQNVVRTFEAQDNITNQVFNDLLAPRGEPISALENSIQACIKNICVDKTIHYNTALKIVPSRRFRTSRLTFHDPAFWSIVEKIIQNVERGNYPHSKEEALRPLLTLHKSKRLNDTEHNIYYYLESLTELLFAFAVAKAQDVKCGDGYGSDSEQEITFERDRKPISEKLHTKKIITHNGMRAIICAVKAATHLNSGCCRIFLDESYYETPSGLQLTADLEKLRIIRVANPSLANVLFYDLNPCITNGTPTKRTFNPGEQKILIVDTTSAISADTHKIINDFFNSRASVLFFVESGLKNQQLGADKNPYGVVRIFTRDKKILNETYEYIKKNEQPLRSLTSHFLRRLMKEIGCAPVTKQFIYPPTPKLT